MGSHFAGWPHGGFGGLGPGSRIAGYLIEKQIGAGGMAVVFRARDEMLGRPAAVKVIAPAMGDDPGFHARFLRESRAAVAVDSLHIIPVYGAGEADGLLYIASRFVEGGDLWTLLRRSKGRLTPKRVIDLIEQVASALNAAHLSGVIHRDVKPHNILVDTRLEPTGHAFLSDFGLSKAIQSSTQLTAAGQFIGTPQYSSPEQIRNIGVDERTDQYALACVAFVLLTGKLPFDRGEVMATLFAQVNDPVPRASELRDGLPPAVDDVLARALAKAADDRYATCIEFAEALRGALTPARPAPPAPKVPQRRKPHDGLRQTGELGGLLGANRRVRADDPPPKEPPPRAPWEAPWAPPLPKEPSLKAPAPSKEPPPKEPSPKAPAPREEPPSKEPSPPEDLSRLLGANHRLRADKDVSDPYDEPPGHESKGKHAAGRPPEPEPTDPGALQANRDAGLFSVLLPMQPQSSGSDGGPALPQDAADEAGKADEGGAVDLGGKTHPGRGTGPDDPNEQQKQRWRWTSFLPGMPD